MGKKESNLNVGQLCSQLGWGGKDSSNARFNRKLSAATNRHRDEPISAQNGELINESEKIRRAHELAISFCTKRPEFFPRTSEAIDKSWPSLPTDRDRLVYIGYVSYYYVF